MRSYQEVTRSQERRGVCWVQLPRVQNRDGQGRVSPVCYCGATASDGFMAGQPGRAVPELYPDLPCLVRLPVIALSSGISIVALDVHGMH